MSRIQCCLYDRAEQPTVTVFYSLAEAEGDGWNSPRIPAHIDIESVVDVNGDEVATTSVEDATFRDYIERRRHEEA